MSKSKLLGQFLKEKQEPFALEVYLNERTYHKSTSLSSNFHDPSKILKSSSTFGLKKKRRNSAIPNCSIFLKVLFGRIVSANNNKKIKNSRNGGQISTTLRENRKNREEDVGFQSMKSTGEFFAEKQAKADRKLTCGEVEEHKQLSPVSVLVDTESDDEVSPLHYKQCNSKTTQGESSTSTSTSTSQCKFKKPTYYNTVQEFQEVADSDSYGQYVVNKRLLQQKKQLLIDCAREVIENHKKRDKRREQLKKILGADELWKLVCENLWIWSQDSIDESNIIHLLHSDLLASEEEWSEGSKQQKRDISIEVGDAILDDIINEEIVINGKFVYEL